MARMFPEIFPGPSDPENPEFEVYQQLRRLPDTYVVFFSKRFKGGLFGVDECEIDFIVSNQRDVLICLEVKGGILSYDGRLDRWSQNGEPMKRSPDRQASAATHALIEHLRGKVKNIAIDWALCFPQCCLDSGGSSTALPSAHLIDERKLNDPEECFHLLEQSIRQRYPRAGLTRREAEDLVATLTQGIGFIQKLGVRFARERSQLVQATEEQLEILEDLRSNPRMLIQGSAGTGKTVIAQEFAKRLAADGKSVLLLFYNKGIASKVRFAFARDEAVTVTTFSSFAKRLLEKQDPAWWAEQSAKDDDFWRTHLPLRLLDLSPEALPKFDAVIVDEGQDFKPEWYEFLERMLRSREDSNFCCFLDEHQDIFGHWQRFPIKPHPFRRTLRKNCRNTRRIIDYINRSYPTEMTFFDFSPPGVDVVERTVTSQVDEQTQVIRDVRRLVEIDEVRPGAIVLLINREKRESCLADTKKIAGLPLESTYGRYDETARCVYYSSIEIFKGLEADVILLVDCDAIPAEEFARALYVQGSRARHALYIYNRKQSA